MFLYKQTIRQDKEGVVVIIFNDSNILSDLVPIEISIDGRYIATLKRREFVDVSIECGKHELSIRHKEPFIKKYYQNNYTIEITGSGMALKVYTGLISTKFQHIKELPKKFKSKFININSLHKAGWRKKIMMWLRLFIIIIVFLIGCAGVGGLIGYYGIIKSEKYQHPPCDCDTDSNLPCKINGICLRYYYDPETSLPADDCTGQQFDLDDASRVVLDIEEFISRYDSGFMSRYLTDIFILKALECRGKPYGGTYKRSSIYIRVDPNCTDQWIQGTLHHEFSSILMKNYPFPEDEWRSINDNDFAYTNNAFEMLGKSSLNLQLPGSLDAGFVKEYARTSLENDFNVIVEWLFTRETELCELRKKYDRIDKKADLAINFFKSIGSGVDFMDCESSMPEDITIDKSITEKIPDSIADEKLDTMIAKAAPLIEEITGRKYKSKIEFRIIDRETYRKTLLKKSMEGLSKDLGGMARDMIINRFRLDARKRSKLNISKHSYKQKHIINVIPENINEVKRIFKINDEELDDFLFIIIAHEMVHAIDNQYYDLDKLRHDRESNEAKFALNAVIAGNTAYVTKIIADRLNISETIFGKSLKLDICLLDNPKPVEKENYNLYYIKGAEFIRTMIKEKGIAGYDSVFMSAPVSTRQIRFPEEYFNPPSLAVIDSKMLLERILEDLPVKGMNSSVSTIGMAALRYSLLIHDGINKGDAINVADNLLNSARYYAYEKEPETRTFHISIHNFNDKESAVKYDRMMMALQEKRGEEYKNSPNFSLDIKKEQDLNQEDFNFVRFRHIERKMNDQPRNSIEVIGITGAIRVKINSTNIEYVTEKDLMNILNLINAEILKMKQEYKQI